MARCRARLSIASCDAKLIARSISADNLPYVRTRYEDGLVITEVDAGSIGSLLATLDDILVNIKVANDVLCGINADADMRD
jgi:tRNA threonylcarbamoyladenosine modification (KEOPS) complex  Pcc1 subunit